MKDLAGRAKAKKLMPQEYQGGSFCHFNLGCSESTISMRHQSAPHGAILAVGAGVQKPVVKDGQVAVAR